MKKLIFLFVLSVVLLTSVTVAQVTQITGTTKHKTTILVGSDTKTKEKFPEGQPVIIIDANDYFLTIKYKDGEAFVNRNSIRYNSSEMNELIKTKTGIAGTKTSKTSLDMNIKPLIKTKTGVAGTETSKTSLDMNITPITDINQIEDKYKYEMDHIRYCAGKYRNEIMTGYAFSFAGLATSTATLFMDTAKPKDILLVGKIGYGLSLVGIILIIDSNKWMKKISVGPNGIGIKYVF